MRRPVVLLAIALLVVACRRDRAAPATTSSPDPRLQAVFADIFRSASAAASRARELHENDLLSATRLDE